MYNYLASFVSFQEMDIDIKAENEGDAMSRAFHSRRPTRRSAAMKPVPKHMQRTVFVAPTTPKWLKDLLSGKPDQ